MKIYTKTGDAGDTGLFGGARVSKASAQVEAYGDVDELNSVLGLVRAHGTLGGRFDALMASIQSRLFDVGAELANGKPGKDLGIPLVTEDDVVAMEHAIDHAEESLPALRTFVLPGGTHLAAYLHLARTVCRRAERRVVALGEAGNIVRPEGERPERAIVRPEGERPERAIVRPEGERPERAIVRPEVLRYLNRLSDLLFVLARYANHQAGVVDVPWIGRGTQKTTAAVGTQADEPPEK